MRDERAPKKEASTNRHTTFLHGTERFFLRVLFGRFFFFYWLSLVAVATHTSARNKTRKLTRRQVEKRRRAESNTSQESRIDNSNAHKGPNPIFRDKKKKETT